MYAFGQIFNAENSQILKTQSDRLVPLPIDHLPSFIDLSVILAAATASLTEERLKVDDFYFFDCFSIHEKLNDCLSFTNEVSE